MAPSTCRNSRYGISHASSVSSTNGTSLSARNSTVRREALLDGHAEGPSERSRSGRVVGPRGPAPTAGPASRLGARAGRSRCRGGIRIDAAAGSPGRRLVFARYEPASIARRSCSVCACSGAWRSKSPKPTASPTPRRPIARSSRGCWLACVRVDSRSPERPARSVERVPPFPGLRNGQVEPVQVADQLAVVRGFMLEQVEREPPSGAGPRPPSPASAARTAASEPVSACHDLRRVGVSSREQLNPDQAPASIARL